MKKIIVVAISAALSNALANILSLEMLFVGSANQRNTLAAAHAYGTACMVELVLIFAIVYLVAKTIVHAMTDVY